MRTVPRLVGFRLHTLAVKAGKGCSGSPKASSERGCTWYSMLGHSNCGPLRVKAPSCEGAMLIGPVRNIAYSAPIFSLPHHELASVFNVVTPCTLNTARICKWSCRFSPTPGSSCTTGMPISRSSPEGPMPDSCRICGVPMLPAARITSWFAATWTCCLPSHTSAPVQRSDPSSLFAVSSRMTCAPVHISKLGRP